MSVLSGIWITRVYTQGKLWEPSSLPTMKGSFPNPSAPSFIDFHISWVPGDFCRKPSCIYHNQGCLGRLLYPRAALYKEPEAQWDMGRSWWQSQGCKLAVLSHDLTIALCCLLICSGTEQEESRTDSAKHNSFPGRITLGTTGMQNWINLFSTAHHIAEEGRRPNDAP